MQETGVWPCVLALKKLFLNNINPNLHATFFISRYAECYHMLSLPYRKSMN